MTIEDAQSSHFPATIHNKKTKRIRLRPQNPQNQEELRKQKDLQQELRYLLLFRYTTHKQKLGFPDFKIHTNNQRGNQMIINVTIYFRVIIRLIKKLYCKRLQLF